MKNKLFFIVCMFAIVGVAPSGAETLEIYTNLRLHGPLIGGRAYDAQLHYANGFSFLDVDTNEYAYDWHRQSLFNSSTLIFEQKGGYYYNFETQVGLGEITVARYYDSVGGNPMYSTTVGQDINVNDGNIYTLNLYSSHISTSTISTGSLNASTVVTTPKWQIPDYVFEPDYVRRSLPELEAFVRANRHLPDVPSASAIKEHGMDLTEMNVKLLKTVEELTLHVIDLDKALKAQQEANARLAAEVNVLKTGIQED